MKKPKPSWMKHYELYQKLGSYKLVAKELNISHETVKRGVRAVKAWKKESEPTPNAMLTELANHFSPDEIRALIKGKKTAKESHFAIHDFNGEEITLGVLSDTHIGSKYTNDDYILEAFEQFALANVDMVVHPGDVTEGMSNRPGHVLECTQIGYNHQREHAIKILSQWDASPFYMISGNHDDWYIKSNGAQIVKDICDQIPNATFLGNGEGNIQLGATQVRLWHGLDGSSYAHSYRMQKIVESLTGGDKPNVLIAGHTHKAFYTYDRHIHCISAGCIQKQSSWMRQKRLPSHTGFWILRITLHDKGVARFASEWFPFYV